METITQKNTITDKLISEFELSKNSLFGNLKLRKQAMEAFSKQGIPNRKHEEYKYLNIDLILKSEFALSTNKTSTKGQIEYTGFLKDAIVVLVENGVFVETLSKSQNLPKGLTICSLADASKNQKEIFEKHYAKYADINTDAFIALNTAMAKDGVFIHIAEGIVIEKPIHIIHLSRANENSIIHPRNMIIVDENAQVKIIESFETIDSTAKTFKNAFARIYDSRSVSAFD